MNMIRKQKKAHKINTQTERRGREKRSERMNYYALDNETSQNEHTYKHTQITRMCYNKKNRTVKLKTLRYFNFKLVFIAYRAVRICDRVCDRKVCARC